ncbi:MAG TPA: hypothetical protein VGJ15_08965 [Pirellulales bacterium]|jgi:hypothetical protein
MMHLNWLFAEITPPAGPHGDTIPIMLMLFFVALGLIIVCRTSRRSAEIKLDDLDD